MVARVPLRTLVGPVTDGYAGTATAVGAQVDMAAWLNARTLAWRLPGVMPPTTALPALAGTTTRLSSIRIAKWVSGTPPVSAGGCQVTVTRPRPLGVATTLTGGCGGKAATTATRVRAAGAGHTSY